MNQVQQADAFEALSELRDSSAHAAIVDYPWEFTIQNGTGRFEYRRVAGQGEGEEDRNIDRSDVMFQMEEDESIQTVLDELRRVLVDGAWIVFMADDRFQDVVRKAMQDVDGIILRRNWIWTPENMGMGYYGRIDHYPMPVATVGETDRYVTGRSTLFRVPNGRDTEYPTGKPVDLYRQLLAAPVIRNGERLLEPFCGSGPGAAVASSRGLDYWGCDVDSKAVEKTRERFEQQRLGGQTTLSDSTTATDSGAADDN